MRTKLQALQHVLREFNAGRLGALKNTKAAAYGCVYCNGERRCSVGCLFTEAQLNDIQRRGLNANTSISGLAADYHIGRRNIETVTGMEVADLVVMQGAHDLAYRDSGDRRPTAFRDWLKAQIKLETNKGKK